MAIRIFRKIIFQLTLITDLASVAGEALTGAGDGVAMMTGLALTALETVLTEEAFGARLLASVARLTRRALDAYARRRVAWNVVAASVAFLLAIGAEETDRTD